MMIPVPLQDSSPQNEQQPQPQQQHGRAVPRKCSMQRHSYISCVSSVVLRLCAFAVVVAIIPATLLKCGNVEYAHVSGKVGNVEYSYQLTKEKNNNKVVEAEQRTMSMKLKPPSSKLRKSNTTKPNLNVHEPPPSSTKTNKVTTTTQLPPPSTPSTPSTPSPQQDGCSVYDKVEPKWAPHANPRTQTKRMNEIAQCFHRTSPQQEPLREVFANATYLQCHTEASLEILKHYRRVWFMGDSVLFQQYRSLVCMVQPQFAMNQSQHRPCGMETTYTHDLGETSLTYTELGWKFDGEEPLYQTVFPQALASSTSVDAIVLNAGLHYDATRGHFLKNAMTFIKEQAASHPNQTIFVMEASDEQWPTSNGIWTMECTGTCQCEALTPERRQGHGSWGPHHAEVSRNIGLVPPPQKSTYEYLYPELFSTPEKNKSLLDPAHCVPSCLPANWRNDIIHSILVEDHHDDSTTTTTTMTTTLPNLHIVPIWNQLVAHHQVHNRKVGDCTHKSIDALVMMNEQLFRSLTLAAPPSYTTTNNQRRRPQGGSLLERHPAPPTKCVKGGIGDPRAHQADIQAGTILPKSPPLPLPTTTTTTTTTAPRNHIHNTNHNHKSSNNKLRVIVTGMEHTGTTILSELLMSAPGFMGPFETGFLLAETPSNFRQVTPFFQWVSRTDVQNAFLGLSPPQVQTLLQQPTHTDMYTYAMEHSVLFQNIPSQWYVDKTPSYVYNLKQVMERAGPGVKVVVTLKSYQATYQSWVKRRHASEKDFKAAYQLFQTSVQEASQAFPGQIYFQDYHDLFGNYIQGKKPLAYVAGKSLFDWLGIEWKNTYFTGKACASKGRTCNIASLLDH